MDRTAILIRLQELKKEGADRPFWKLDTKFYFAHPYHSWERGLNENTNGLIRQYLPKKTNFTKVTKEEILSIQDKLNHRPKGAKLSNALRSLL